MAESPEGYIVDTNVLVSKKLRVLERVGKPLYITETVVLEYMNWVARQRRLMLQRGERERAKGYERLLRLFPRLLESLGITLLPTQLDSEAVEEAARLVIERDVDPGDALIAVTAKRLRLGVVSGDRDWERLRDYIQDLLVP